jgi:hypothetical protein
MGEGREGIGQTPDVRLTLRPLPSDVPVDVRLRKALKGLLRAHGFKCLLVEDVGPGEPPGEKASEGG